jgi:hypothetical protein
MTPEEIYIEDRFIYDGWCATYNPETKEIKWRGAWFTEKLTPEFKRAWEEKILSQMIER